MRQNGKTTKSIISVVAYKEDSRMGRYMYVYVSDSLCVWRDDG